MLKHHSWKTFVECRHSRKLEFHFFCFARLQSDTLSPLTRSFGFLFRAERWRSVFQWAPCGAQEVTLGPAAAVPSSVLNREFLQLCTSCIFSVLGRCACYKIVTTTYLSESLSMCIHTLCMQHCSVRQEVSSRPKCSHTPIPYCDSRV